MDSNSNRIAQHNINFASHHHFQMERPSRHHSPSRGPLKEKVVVVKLTESGSRSAAPIREAHFSARRSFELFQTSIRGITRKSCSDKGHPMLAGEPPYVCQKKMAGLLSANIMIGKLRKGIGAFIGLSIVTMRFERPYKKDRVRSRVLVVPSNLKNSRRVSSPWLARVITYEAFNVAQW
jgi:hypothetical protein